MTCLLLTTMMVQRTTTSNVTVAETLHVPVAVRVQEVLVDATHRGQHGGEEVWQVAERLVVGLLSLLLVMEAFVIRGRKFFESKWPLWNPNSLTSNWSTVKIF